MNRKIHDLNFLWQICIFFIFAIAIVMIPGFAEAGSGAPPSSSGVDSPMGNVLCTAVGWSLGSAGKGIATLAIIIIGIGASFGKVSWGMAMTVGVGISVIFNCYNIVNEMGANAEGCA